MFSKLDTANTFKNGGVYIVGNKNGNKDKQAFDFVHYDFKKSSYIET